MRLEECERCGEATTGRHPCPYESKVNNNSDEDYCNCCNDCMKDCEDET